MFPGFCSSIVNSFIQITNRSSYIISTLYIVSATVVQVANFVVNCIDLRVDVIDGIDYSSRASSVLYFFAELGNIAYIAGFCHIRNRNCANRSTGLVDYIKSYALHIFTSCVLDRRNRIRTCFDMGIRIIGFSGFLNLLFKLGNIDSIRVIDTCFDVDDATRHSLFTGLTYRDNTVRSIRLQDILLRRLATIAKSHGSSSGSEAPGAYSHAIKTCFASITQGRSKLISRFTKATQGHGSHSGRFRIGSYCRGLVSSRSASTKVIGHGTDAGTVRTFALSLLAQGDGPFGSCFRKTAYSRRIRPLGMALITNGDGIDTVSFSLGASSDGDGILSRSLRAIAYGQGPFAISYGIVAQGRGTQAPVCMGTGTDG